MPLAILYSVFRLEPRFLLHDLDGWSMLLKDGACSRFEQSDVRRRLVWTKIGRFKAQTCVCDAHHSATRGVDATSHGGPGVPETDEAVYQRLVAKGYQVAARRAIARVCAEVTERM